MTKEQFLSFCDRQGSRRYDTGTPYKAGDFTVATDTKLAVFVPRNEQWEGETNGERASFEKLNVFEQFQKGEWTDFAEIAAAIPPDEFAVCDGCGGGGRCECLRCEVDHSCGDCDGSGKESIHTRVAVLGNDYDNRLLNKFLVIGPKDCRSHTLPAVDPYGKPRKSAAHCLLIRGDGWTGTLMSMAPPDA